MKKPLLILLICLFAVTGCKKEKATEIKPVETIETQGITAHAMSQKLTVTGLSPANVTEGTVVTISGSNFGSTASGMDVYFQHVKAKIQSVKPTEIMVIVPKTTNGTVTFKINGKPVPTSLALTFIYHTVTQINADVRLFTQSAVDEFVKRYKGSMLKINGNLDIGDYNGTTIIPSVAGLTGMISSVSGRISLHNIPAADASFLSTVKSAGGFYVSRCGFKTFDFSALESFSGNLVLDSVNNLSRININKLIKVDQLELSWNKLIDLSFLNYIKSAKSIDIAFCGNSNISMDNLTEVGSGGIKLSYLNSKAITFKSLTKVNGELYLYVCSSATRLNFRELKMVNGRLTVLGLPITDLSGFEAIQTLGAMNICSNSLLTSLHGLEHLTTLTLPGVTGNVIAGIMTGEGGMISSLGGISIYDNDKLMSLAGLQNVKTLPIAYIAENSALNDLCPFKGPINKLKTARPFAYTEFNESSGQYNNQIVSALSLLNNGSYKTTKIALTAVANCK